MDNAQDKSSSLKINSRKVDVTVLDLSGRMTLGGGSAAFRDKMSDLLKQCDCNILLNMGDVSYVDSSGIGELYTALTSAQGRGGDIKLIHLTPKVEGLLRTTKLYDKFDVQPEEGAAIKAFEQKKPGFAAQEQERRTESSPERGV